MVDEARFAYMLTWLQHKFVPAQVIENLFGIQLEQQLAGYTRAWLNTLRRPQDIMNDEGNVNRHLLETYLQQMGLLPVKLAAARLGMDLDSFQKLLDHIEENHIAPLNQSYGKNIVEESLVGSIHKYLPQARNVLFNNHTGYCQRLHDAIREEWGVEIVALHCATSTQLQDDPINFAYEYDSLSGEPLGLRYQVWLDFKKPINLQPDICSIKLYSEKEEALSRFLFAGKRPELPQALVRP